MKKEEKFIVEGKVLETLPNAMFRVEIDMPAGPPPVVDITAPSAASAAVPTKKHIILAHICGKMRMHYIKILQGDKVKVELSPYDMTRGRIIYRSK